MTFSAWTIAIFAQRVITTLLNVVRRYNARLPYWERITRIMSVQSILSLFSARESRILCVLVVAACVYRDAVLILPDSSAIGLDAYYYVLQADSLRTIGHIYFPTHFSAVFYPLALLSYFTPNTIVAIKLGSLLLETLLFAAIFFVVRLCSGTRTLAGLAVVVAASSNLHLYMLTEFIRQLACLTFLIWSIYFALNSIQIGKAASRCLASGCLVAAILSHRSALPMLILILVSVGVVRMLLAKQQYLRYCGLAVGFIAWLSPAAIASSRLCAQTTRICETVSSNMQSPFQSVGKLELIAVVVLAGVSLALVWFAERQMPSRLWCYVVGSVAIWSLLITLNPFLDRAHGWTGVAGRLSGLAFVQLAVLLPGLILAFRKQRVVAYSLLSLAAILLAFGGQSPLPVGMRPEYIRKRQELIQALSLNSTAVASKPLIIAAHGQEFMITSLFGVASQHSRPLSVSSADSAYWLLEGLPANYSSHSMTVLKTDPGGLRTALVADRDLWGQEQLMNGSDWKAILDLNPHLREYYKTTPAAGKTTPPPIAAN